MSQLLLNALHCHNQERPPIWLMRQAGRYLQEYQVMRKGRRLYDLFHDLEAIIQATLLPINLLQVDAAILFTDILTVLEGLSIRYDFVDGTGPVVHALPDELLMIEPQTAYAHITSAIRALKKELSVPLLGFAGAPFTIACYLIEGKTSRDQAKTKRRLFSDPAGFQELIDTLTTATIAYLNCQIDAGVDAVQLFDSWASALGVWEFREYCLKPMQKIVSAIKPRVPIILFCRGSSLFASELASLKPSAISIDWSGDLPTIRKGIPRTIALQGNLDPMVLYGTRAGIEQATDRLLEGMQKEPGYIFNLGHGVLPDTPADHVKFLVDYVRTRSEAFAAA